MRHIPIITALAFGLAIPCACAESEFDRIRRVHGENANRLFESVLQSPKIPPLQGGFAHLWLNRDLEEGNRMIRVAHQAIITNEGGTDVMTAEIASSEHVKWQMRTWNRIYHLFNGRSESHPGRLDKETQAMIEEMFWLYVSRMSRFERAAPQHVMAIHGSENHEMMHYGNALLALQAIKDLPAYKDRKLPDGRSAQEHYGAWNAYYKLYCVERAKRGLLIEIFSGYGKYTMPELLNMRDFSEDPALRRKMENLLHLIWTDWALAQVIGVRGGGRLRMISYDHCTPDYVMGSLMIDPTLPQAGSHDYLKGKDLEEGYPALTAQNRYHCIVFASDVNARVVPQCEGLGNHKTYGEQQAVQHHNVMLVQRHAQARQTGDMRILFGGKGMKDRLAVRDGWLILKEGEAWLGIKGYSRTEPNASCGNKWDNDIYLRMGDGKAPVALIAGRAKDFPDLDAFAKYLATFSGRLEDGWFTLVIGGDASLSLHLESKALPKVNGAPIDLRPKMLFDSPFMVSEYGSGVVTIRKGGRTLEIEMNRAAP